MRSTYNLHQMQTLEELKRHFIDELIHQDLRRVFYILRQNVDNQSIKYDDINLLHARYITASHDQNVKGILPSEEARIVFNQIKATLLDFINHLTPQDLNLEPTAAPVSIPTQVKDLSQKSTCNKGKILYKVPGIMELKKERKCIVRIAFDEKELEINDRQNAGSKVEPIRIAEVMEVQFIDQSINQAFNIRTISSAEQLVDRGDFTEWIFYVEPLLQGMYDLILKVSVIEKRLGREIRKDIVMEKKIEVVANPVEINDHLGIDAHENTKLAAGLGFMIPSGFEIWPQSVVLDKPLISPLNPDSIINTPPPPPPYAPANELGSIGWIAVASAALIAVVGYFTDAITSPQPPRPISQHELSINPSIDSTEELLTLSVKGNYPPFTLDLEKKEDSIFTFSPISLAKSDSTLFSFYSLGLQQGDSASFVATISDRNDSLVEANFEIKWKIPKPGSTNQYAIQANITNDKKSLNLNILNGHFPFQVSIIDQNNKSKKWSAPLIKPIIKSRDTTFSFKSLKSFPQEGNFKIEVVDMSHKMASDEFNLTMQDILTLNTTIDKKSKKLKIKVNGNRPPFKVFLDDKIIKSYEVKFSNRNLQGKENVNVKVQDEHGNTKTKLVKMELDPIAPPKPKPKPPIKVVDCIPPEQLDKTCSIFYIYEEATPQNWDMKANTFSDNRVINVLNNNYTVYHLNRNEMAIDCGTGIYTDLEYANTFIFNGDGSEPIPVLGAIPANKFLSLLKCKSTPKGGEDKESDDDGTEHQKRKKSLKVQLEPGVTYQLQRKEDKKGFSIITSSPMFRVQIASFLEEPVFNRFVKKLEDIGEKVYVKTDTTHLRVYLGSYNSRDEALIEMKRLRQNAELNGILEEEKIPNILVPLVKI